ncbi:MAG: hypothetical protein Q7J57_04560, partial [Gemmobacter sp.]|nr:hypothetical protein [Gemmobacter sp.]
PPRPSGTAALILRGLAQDPRRAVSVATDLCAGLQRGQGTILANQRWNAAGSVHVLGLDVLCQ